MADLRRLGAVQRYAPWHEVAAGPVVRTETPTGHVALILSFGPSLRVSSASAPEPRTLTSFAVGMYDEPATTAHDGVGFGVQIDLSAQSAFALLGVPMDELANRTVPLHDLGPLDVDRLVDRLLDARAWSTRFDVLNDELGAAMARGPRLSPEVAWVERRLRSNPATARIGVLADEVGWTNTKLVERFRREVGLPPKTIARVLRYRHAVAHMSRTPRRPLSDIAAEAGYADQAHFTREFRAFSAQTPTEFLASTSL